MAIEGQRARLRPAVVPDDVEMLLEWHADPDVIRYWDDRTFTRDEIIGRLLRANVEPFVIECEGAVVGYIEARESDDGSRGGVDMFLAPDHRGEGIGSDAARALAQYLLEERGWRAVTADPYLWNERALRAWRNAGFVQVQECPPDDLHLSSWVLMEFRGMAPSEQAV